MAKIISWLDQVWKGVLLITVGLIGLLWWTRRDAINSYKDKHDEEAVGRASAANDAATDARRLEPDDVARRMQSEGWFRD